MVKTLPKHGANIDAKIHEGIAPLLLAAMNDKCQVIEIPLHRASGNEILAAVRELLKHRATITAKNFRGAMPLHHACINGHLEVVRELVECGGVNDTPFTSLVGKGTNP